MRKLVSSRPTLKLNKVIRLVLKIITVSGYFLFIVGLVNNFSTIFWYGGAVLIFLCASVLCAVLFFKESQLKEYASSVYTINLPNPDYNSGFWKRRRASLVSLYGALLFLGFGYVMFKMSFMFSVLSIVASFVLLMYHIKIHPKKGSTYRVPNLV
jgi:hypothetical protein